jgi:uncharacterized damage-inducible protein DinB
MESRMLMVMALATLPGSALAQQMPMQHGHAGSVASVRPLYDMVKRYIVQTAELMPEADYSFKPTSDVRSFGELVGHVANASYLFCSIVKGEQNPATTDFEKAATKAALVQGLKDAFAYCDGAYQITDMQAMDEVSFPFGNMKGSKLWALTFNQSHDWEHYGNMVTYLRLKGLVPPSSRGGM